jgi:peptide/nickel transport system permease protein
MTKSLLKKLRNALIVLLGVSIIVFMLMYLSGDPVALLLPMDTSPEIVAEMRENLGFNDPLYIQYLNFLSGAVRGDFGDSLHHGQPAMGLILERMPATIELTLASIAVALLIAIPLGIITAVYSNTIIDYIGSVIALIGQSMPVFWLGLMLLYLVGVKYRLLPITGRGSWEHLILPAITVGAYTAATLARMLRSRMIEIMQQDYIKTAKAKGVKGFFVIMKHALRNALLPVITILAMQLGTLLGGAVITETIFAWPGVGRFMLQAIQNRDIAIVQAGVFVLAVSIVVINISTDVIYSLLDPRIRYE